MDSIEPTGRLIGFTPDALGAVQCGAESFHAVAAEVYDLPTYAASRSRSLAREYVPEQAGPNTLETVGEAADRLYAEIASRWMRDGRTQSPSMVLRLHNPNDLPFAEHTFDLGPDVA